MSRVAQYGIHLPRVIQLSRFYCSTNTVEHGSLNHSREDYELFSYCSTNAVEPGWMNHPLETYVVFSYPGCSLEEIKFSIFIVFFNKVNSPALLFVTSGFLVY